MDPTSALDPPSNLKLWPSEALAVLVALVVLVVVVAVLLPVDMAEPELAAAVAGREESFASVYSHRSLVSHFSLHKT